MTPQDALNPELLCACMALYLGLCRPPSLYPGFSYASITIFRLFAGLHPYIQGFLQASITIFRVCAGLHPYIQGSTGLHHYICGFLQASITTASYQLEAAALPVLQRMPIQDYISYRAIIQVSPSSCVLSCTIAQCLLQCIPTQDTSPVAPEAQVSPPQQL